MADADRVWLSGSASQRRLRWSVDLALLQLGRQPGTAGGRGPRSGGDVGWGAGLYVGVGDGVVRYVVVR